MAPPFPPSPCWPVTRLGGLLRPAWLDWWGLVPLVSPSPFWGFSWPLGSFNFLERLPSVHGVAFLSLRRLTLLVQCSFHFVQNKRSTGPRLGPSRSQFALKVICVFPGSMCVSVCLLLSLAGQPQANPLCYMFLWGLTSVSLHVALTVKQNDRFWLILHVLW